MAEKIQAVRGMHDILPDQSQYWRYVEKTIEMIFERYGYAEIRMPIVEKTELFERSIGESSDIVSKEMYTFTDRNKERLTLRPEGTASCVRAGLEHGLFNNVQRLWYTGPMFRRERPQKGRTRQFHQISAEAFGLKGPDIDAEIIIMSARIWLEFGLNDIALQLNTLGTSSTRQKFRQILVEYFSDHIDDLDNDSRNRLKHNPLRILDSKNPSMQSLINAAPTIDECLDVESADHYEGLKSLLTEINIPFIVNPRLVRGLDYYNKTVFEWTTDHLGAQSAVCAGGRYDGLVEHFGGKATPAVGFSLGLERLISLLQTESLHDVKRKQNPHAYLIIAGEKAKPHGFKLAEQLREKIPLLRLVIHCGEGSLKNQFKKADKSGAQFALILGDEELTKKSIAIKSLRQNVEQTESSWENLADTLTTSLKL